MPIGAVCLFAAPNTSFKRTAAPPLNSIVRPRCGCLANSCWHVTSDVVFFTHASHFGAAHREIEMNDYQVRKATRAEAFKAAQGKPQARRVFRVYATSIMNELPESFAGRCLGAFASRADADAFAFGNAGTQHDISSYESAPAFRALSSMLPRGTMCAACYTRFHVAAEEA